MEDGTAYVAWQPPRSSHGKVEGYKVSYSIIGESYVEERRLDEEKLQYKTGTLRKYNYLQVQVLVVDYGFTF